MSIRLPLLALYVALGCSSAPSGPGSSPPPPAPPPPPPPPSGAVTVQVQNNVFSPSVASIAVGGTVTWSWTGNGHNVTSTGSPSFAPNSATASSPFTHGPLTFNTAGTYQYVCTIHQGTGMTGSVVVQ